MVMWVKDLHLYSVEHRRIEYVNSSVNLVAYVDLGFFNKFVDLPSFFEHHNAILGRLFNFGNLLPRDPASGCGMKTDRND